MAAQSAQERVLLFITYLVGFLAVVLVVGVFLVGIYAPEASKNLDGLVELLSNAFLMLVGAVVGYIGGMGVGTAMNSSKPPDEGEPRS